MPSHRFTSQELLKHPWIESRERKDEDNFGGFAKYKASLSKTNDEGEELVKPVDGRLKSREVASAKDQKIKEIEVYMGEKSRERQRKKKGDR